MERGAWRAAVHGVTESQTGLGDLGYKSIVLNQTLFLYI